MTSIPAPVRRRPRWVPTGGGYDTTSLLFDVAAEAARLIDERLLAAAKAADDDLAIQALGHSSFRLLDLIEGAPGIRPTQAAAAMHIRQNSVAGMLNRMEDAGLVTRERERYRDRRTLKLYVTDKGRLIAARMRSIAGEVDAFVLAAMARGRNPLDALQQALQELTDAHA